MEGDSGTNLEWAESHFGLKPGSHLMKVLFPLTKVERDKAAISLILLPVAMRRRKRSFKVRRIKGISLISSNLSVWRKVRM